QSLQALRPADTKKAPASAPTSADTSAPVYPFLSPPQQPGELGRLGKFRLLRLLGTGGMGMVFEAEDLALQRPTALKVIRPAVAGRETARGRFLLEARAAAKLNHEHVVSIFQVDEAQGVPFIAMPLLVGETLETRLSRDGPLPTAEVLRIGREIAEGLAA